MDFSEPGLVSIYNTCMVHPDAQAVGARMVAIIMEGKGRYLVVSEQSGVPWELIGCLHALESHFDFSTHLANGDPLSARTVHVPAGMPKTGEPPFTWEESAADTLGRMWRPLKWDLGGTLDCMEHWNGLGYRKRDICTPYIWAGTSAYISGKYVADGSFDPNAVSKQVGAACLLKGLEF
jgi:lysozyme family protein